MESQKAQPVEWMMNTADLRVPSIPVRVITLSIKHMIDHHELLISGTVTCVCTVDHCPRLHSEKKPTAPKIL
jgi:hypothetical protein